MLKRLLCMYAIATAFRVCAAEADSEPTKILPGALVCDCIENKCKKGDTEEATRPVSGAVSYAEKEEQESVACGEDEKDETKVACQEDEKENNILLACKDCQ